MKKSKRILSMFLALVMIIGMVLPVFAAEGDTGDGTDENQTPAEHQTTVNIHKILMKEEEFNKKDEAGKPVWPKDHDGSKIEDIKGFFGDGTEEIPGVAFRIYQVKDAAEEGFVAQTDASLKDYASDLDADKFYKLIQVNNKDFVLTGDDGVAQVTLKDGTYRIVEDKLNSTYKGDKGEALTGSKAVPFTLVLPAGLPDGSGYYGTDTPLHVYPKNTENKPKIDKNFDENSELKKTDGTTAVDSSIKYEQNTRDKDTATVTVGDNVPFQVKTVIPAGSAYQNLTWTDSMTNGLTFVTTTDSLNGVVLTAQKGTLGTDEKFTSEGTVEFAAGKDYTVVADARGFTLKFEKSGFDKLNAITKPVNEKGESTGAGKDVEITLKYNALVNGNAVVEKVDENNIKLEFDNKPGKTIEEVDVKSSNKKLNVTKTWGDGATVPEDAIATFVLKDGEKTYAVTLKKGVTEGEFDLGDGIKFTIAGEFKGTFEGLDDNKTYKLTERVAGYTPEYKTETGSVVITNKKNENTPEPLNPSEPKVVTYGKKFVKADKTDGTRLAGAQFVIKNKEDKYLAIKTATEIAESTKAYEDAETEYKTAVNRANELLAKTEDLTDDETTELNKLQGDINTEGSIEFLKKDRDAKFKLARENYNWISLDTAPTAKDPQGALVLTSDDQGRFEITGLASGTYTLVEIKAPDGYAIPTNNKTEFTVGESSYSTGTVVYEGTDPVVDDAEGSNAMRVNNTKVTIPQTGGIGTVIFAVVGIALMGGAVVAMKKRNSAEG